jgi:hypothetical protein
MELENIILSKVSQTQKAKNHMFSLMCKNNKILKNLEDLWEKRISNLSFPRVN